MEGFQHWELQQRILHNGNFWISASLGNHPSPCASPVAETSWRFITQVPRDLGSHSGRYQKSSTCLLQQQPTAKFDDRALQNGFPFSKGNHGLGSPLTLESKGQRDALKALTRWEEQNKTHIPWLAAHIALNQRQKNNNNKNRQVNLYISYLQNMDWVLQFCFSNFRWFSELSPLQFSPFLKNYLQIFPNTYPKFLLSYCHDSFYL